MGRRERKRREKTTGREVGHKGLKTTGFQACIYGWILFVCLFNDSSFIYFSFFFSRTLKQNKISYCKKEKGDFSHELI